MLSSVLNSHRAIIVNIQIMRAFVTLRGLLETHEGLARKIDEMEKKYDQQFKNIFEVIQQLISTPDNLQGKPKRQIGFQVEEPKAKYGSQKDKMKRNR